MKHLNKVLAISTLLIASGAHAQTTQKLSTGKNNEYGLTYSLPTTAVDVTFEVRHRVSVPGEFYNYAKRYLDIDNVIVEPSQECEIIGVVVIPRGIANPNDLWLAKFKNGSTVSMTLTDSDIPLAINLEEVTEPSTPELPKAIPAKPTPLETPEARQAVTQEMSASSSLSQKARLAAQRIFELRESRNELLGGSAENMPPDGKAMELVLANIAAQEAALTAMFTGTVSEYTTVRTVTYTPRKDDLEPTVIARLSPKDGIIDANDLRGEPIKLALSEIIEGKLPVNEKGVTKTFPKGGVAYTIPGSATATISIEGRTLASKPLEISQFGVVFGLDPALFSDKKAPSFVEFSPLTGSIVRIGSVSELEK